MTFTELKEQAENSRFVITDSISKHVPGEEPEEIPDDLLDSADTDFRQAMDTLMSLRIMLEGERSHRKLLRRVQAGEVF